ncbi:4Fe-4S dicluster domain-containing protein [Proteiniborus ethanoligenes]|uniref:4Fe-4S dicluster domain-containing protein n=1 Tax=Proteiniborus ethanoligenes TaxID=415015 RepID=A0A1H3K3U9_9FIRM|nr:aldo/keto reductase [Proteiniborus ethanoligenes]TAH61862.1 MAG: 4Fe-4S dicluster domain-containing protein [Gottschalkiaceae bacterium]SDY46425.1 4Fe-4S dicluster domain-containing protein [Proteiniborus ethanoligenes]
MESRILGNTGIKISELCFGSLTIGPLQANLDIYHGGQIISHAFNNGINFIDTAEIYENYLHIREALKTVNRKDIVIATKSYSYSKETAEKSLMKALRELNTDYIDIFLLHEQESKHTIRGHYEAIEYFLKAKEKGIIRAIGISTHRIEGVVAATQYSEIEVIHPIINKLGIGIQDGSVDDMLIALKAAYNSGKGIYGMKPLGGGHLIKDVEDSIRFVKGIPYLHSFAMGMQSKDEVDANISLVNNGYIPKDIKLKIDKKERRLHISDWCIGCGSCVETCKNGGIKLIDNKAVPIMESCVLCGYCAPKCPEFCIKVI